MVPQEKVGFQVIIKNMLGLTMFHLKYANKLESNLQTEDTKHNYKQVFMYIKKEIVCH